MKHPYLFLCGAMLLCNASFAQTTYPGGVTNCIARWDFTSTGTFTSLADASGNSNTGSTHNLTGSAGFRGDANTAGSFNGTSSYVAVTNNAMLSPSAISIVALVKPTSYYTGGCQYNTILLKGTDYNVSGCYGMSIFDNDNDCSSLGLNTQQVDFIKSTANGSYTSTPISLNGWYLLVTTYDGSFMKRYTVAMDPLTFNSNINPTTVDPVSAALGSNSADIRIGQNQNASPNYFYPFTGDMDEVALFDKGLTDADVQSIYNYLWGGAMIKQPFVDTFVCPGANFKVDYTVFNNNAFSAGNLFTVQLSDATGNFSTPTNIGSATSTTSGSITCTMPSTLSLGGHYRIRLAGTNPLYTSPDNGKDIVLGHATTTSAITANPGNTVANGVSVTFTAAANNAGTSTGYIWMRNSTVITSATNATYTGVSGADFKNGDTITAKVIVTDNNCGYTDTAVSNQIVMSVGVGIKNVINDNNLKIYPNPNSGSFNITGQTSSSQSLDIEVLNTIGQSVYHTTWTPVNNKINENLQLSDLPSGIYTLRARSGEGISTVRFTISK